jgi:AcrR family transcriptional regulator
MARSTRRGPGNGQGERPGAAPEGEPERIIDAALALIPTAGWRRLSLSAIAAEAGLPLVSVYRAFRSKAAILARFSRRIDEKALAGPPAAEPEARPRDRLFDLLMRRFDALRPYRAALAVLRRELPGDPAAALCTGAAVLRSMRWMLDAAGIATAGLGGALALKLTAVAYLSAMRVFEGDDSPDLGRTMAALDRSLSRIELVLRPHSRPRGAAASTAA